MALTLTVTSRQSQQLGPAAVKVFRGSGGTIGRAAGNDWVLADAFVSKQHAVIEVVGHEYRLRDTSTNGTYLNGSEQPIGHGSSVPLNHGDRVLIGEYELAVTLTADLPEHASQPAFPSAAPPLQPVFVDTAAIPRQPSPWPASLPPAARDTGQPARWDIGGSGSEAEDPLLAMENRRGQSRPSADASPFDPPPNQGAWPGSDPLRDAYVPSANMGGSESAEVEIPDNWNRTVFPGAGMSAPIPPAAPKAPPMPSQTHHAVTGTHPALPVQPPPARPIPGPATPDAGALVRLLEATGMDPAAAQAAAANPALADDLGQVLQIVVQGLIKVLQARSEIKDTFRLQHTRMRPQENNPLKFSPDSRAALSALFAQRVPGFLTPTETFQEAFADIEAHQMAMLAGMRAAFDNVMQRFDPESLEAEFNRDKGGGMFKPLNKARYWDKLVEMYGRQSSNSDESFRRLFGDAFAEAYEQQMQRLTATRRRR